MSTIKDQLLTDSIKDVNSSAIQNVSNYNKIVSILEKARNATGKKVNYSISDSSTVSQKLNFKQSVYASTH